MTNKICGIQMDPLDTVKINLDSSFALGVEAQRRGYQIFHYLPTDVTYHAAKGRVMARGQFVRFHNDPANPFSDHRPVAAQPLDECQVILLRQDPPFDMSYITSCHLLEMLQHQAGTMVVNNPRAVRSSPEKLAVLYFADLMPPTIISADLHALQSFHDDMGQMILKPLFGKGGSGVAYLGPGDPNLAVYYELHQQAEPNVPLMAQGFIKNVSRGDKRIILVDGEARGWFNRTPVAGQVRANTAAGGGLAACDLTDRDKEIVARLKPWLQQEELWFVGIDVIDGFLTEINVTSPTGIPTSDRLMGTKVAVDTWDMIEKKLVAQGKAA